MSDDTSATILEFKPRKSTAANQAISKENSSQSLTYAAVVEKYGAEKAYAILICVEKLVCMAENYWGLDAKQRFLQALDIVEKIEHTVH